MLVGKALRYKCKSCDHSFDKYQNKEDFLKDIKCEKCNETISADGIVKNSSKKAKNYTVIGAKVENAEYNPGLGAVVKNKRHKEDLMKQKGVVEVGNDFGSGEKQQKEFEKKKKEEIDRVWNEEPKDGFQKFI